MDTNGHDLEGRVQKLAILCFAGLMVLGLCFECRGAERSDEVDLAMLNSVAVAKFGRSVLLPPDRLESFYRIVRLQAAGKWDEALSQCEQMLKDPTFGKSPDVKAWIFASMGDAVLGKSKGEDARGALMWISLALEEAESKPLRSGLLQQIVALTTIVGPPELAKYWKDLESRRKTDASV